MRTHLIVISSAAGLSLAACAQHNEPTGPRVAVGVSPLTLPGIDDTCYGLTVYDAAAAAGQPVWSLSQVCSSQYGNGEGDITYIGTCVDENPTGPSVNSVALVLEHLCSGGPCYVADALTNAIPTTEFVNPCDASAGLIGQRSGQALAAGEFERRRHFGTPRPSPFPSACPGWLGEV